MSHALTSRPQTDPTHLYRYRDGLYAEDMLITALVWLDLFSWLNENPSDQAAICEHFQLNERPADVMLTLMVAMDLLERRPAQDSGTRPEVAELQSYEVTKTRSVVAYHVTPVAQEHLVKSSPWFLGPYYASMKERPVCKDLLQVLRTGKPANWAGEKDKQDWHKSMETKEFATQFTAAMDCRGVYLAGAAAKNLDLGRSRQLLDIAGGSGVYACAFCAHFANLQASVLEKPPVDRIAADAIASRGFASKVDVIASDMLTSPLPAGFDVHLFSNVLHDWDVATVRLLITKSFAALEPGGVIVIHDAHLNEHKTGPLHVAEYSVMLMHACEGRCYSVAEIQQYLGEAGFVDFKYTPTAAARSVITATKG